MKKNIHFKLDTRNSFISARGAQIWGVKIGADFGNKLRMGLGYNFLNSNFSSSVEMVVSSNTLIYSRQLHIQYICAYLEYVFYRKEKWEFSVPVQIGFGTSWYSYGGNSIPYPSTKKYSLLLYEPTLSGQYKFFSWLGVGADVGFRFAPIKSKKIEEQLTSPIYVGKILIYWGDIYNKIFPKDPLQKLKEKLF